MTLPSRNNKINRLYIGLMTGTSVDGVDGVLVSIPDDYTSGFLYPLATAYIPFSDELRNSLLSLQEAGFNEIEKEAVAANDLAHFYARCVFDLLKQASLTADVITAIAVHGQTIRHRPELGFTRQTNNPALLAELTGIDVVADFRSRDIAAHGQGAPLVPAFHHAFFCENDASCVVLNIGGIANISVLENRKILGFDTGPGNVLMDLWISKNKNLLYDEDGKWAASGKPNQDLLDLMLSEPFLSLSPPKSTGRDLFNEHWLNTKLSAVSFSGFAPEDVQATLSAFTVQTVTDAIIRYAPTAKSVFVCGGGAKNLHLITQLQISLNRTVPEMEIISSEEVGIDPSHIEALAFAWLAHRFVLRLPGNLPEVTGAKGFRILGALYPGSIKKTISFKK